jgi:hypothetical protein
MRIILQPGFDGRESMAAFKACRSLGVPFVVGRPQFAEPGDVPIGSVEYCNDVLAALWSPIPKPDFYPGFLHNWMHRTWDRICVTGSEFLTCPMFVKSGEGYKVGESKVQPERYRLPRGINYLSSPVRFTQEWRYYVADGQVVTSGWYDGSDEDEPAPELGIAWPDGFCGAVDLGRLSTGEIALVECHHGYACGWYGDDAELFVLWQIECWETLVECLSHGETGFCRLKLPTIPGS